MMVAAYPVVVAPRAPGTINDISDQADANNADIGRVKAYELWRLAAKIGMAYHSAGDPSTTTEPIAAGAMCLDTTNNDMYVCTARNTPTWTLLAE